MTFSHLFQDKQDSIYEEAKGLVDSQEDKK